MGIAVLTLGVSACSSEPNQPSDTDSDQDESEPTEDEDDDDDEAQGEPSADAARPRDGGASRDSGRSDAGASLAPSEAGMEQGPLDAGGASDGSSDPAPETASCESDAEPLSPDVALPIVFIHGFAGSAQQYESQAMRFAANGYPLERIRALDHDGEGFNTSGFVSQADELVDEVLSEFDADKVYLVGHSRGTFVSDQYLGDARRAAKVAKYISLDGAGCSAAMGAGVPCIAPSQTSLPGQAHVEVATSAESFERQYEFLVGSAPKVVELTAQAAPVEISGRAVNFPANTGRAGTTLQIWELDETGHRATPDPLKTFPIDASGDWGPVVVDPRKHYELTLVAEGSNHHFYPQPFLRCNRLVRLLSGPPDSESRMNTNTGDGHAALVAMRMREWMTTDVLEISTSSPSGGEEPAVNAIVSAVGNDNIAIFLHDDTRTPGESSLSELSAFSGGAFQTGIDVFMPAAEPPDGTITLTNMPRGDSSKPQVLKVPNWISSEHAVTLMFSDFPHP